jgi:hypothetical protein
MISLPLNSSRDLPSQCTSALVGRRIALQLTLPDEQHLYTALAGRWRNASGSAALLLSQLRQMQATASIRGKFMPKPALETLKTLIYAATETFDLYDKYFPEVLKRGRSRSEVKAIQIYKNRIDRLRDPVATMCNRLKHNSREIVSAQIVSETTDQTTFVYRINAAYGGVQRADAVVHRDGGFTSIERTLHEIIHGLLRADYKAGELVRQLSDNCDQPIELKGLANLGLSRLLDDLGGQVPIVAASESNRFYGLAVVGNDLLLKRVEADKVPEPTTRTMLMTVDEVARSIDLI